MKATEYTWSAYDWKQAYEEMVQKVLHYQGFQTKVSSLPVFQKLVEKYPEVNPHLYMQANSPQRRDWWTKRKGQWVTLKFPFPNQLGGKKALDYYHKFLRQGVKQAIPRQDAILRAVKSSVIKLKSCRIDISNYEAVWDMYVLGSISVYAVVLKKDMDRWISSRMRSKEISMEQKLELDKASKVVYSYPGLRLKLLNILKGQ